MPRHPGRFGTNFINAAALAVPLGCVAQAAVAQTNLVQNPYFAITGGSDDTSLQFGDGCGANCNGLGTVADWNTSGYNFVFLPNTADAVGATGTYGTLKLWGPNNDGPNGGAGPENGLPTSAPAPGQNFVAADGAFSVSPITQMINGLIVGDEVAVSFSWAGAQQSGYAGDTTDKWTVDLGSSPAQTTSTLLLPSHGASAWMTQTFYFMATSSSELLSFLATGTPDGEPPFALLANVSVTNVPEPASATIVLSGLVTLIGLTQSRRSRRIGQAKA